MAKVRHALPPIVTGTRCVPVLIPDDDAYVSLLLFAIRKMCQQSYFERDENRTAKQIADLLMSVTYQSVLDNIGTGCDTMVDCETIEDCLGTSPTIENINTTIKDSTKSIYTNVNDATYWSSETNITNAQKQERLLADDMPPPPLGQSCDYDALWSACWQIVSGMDNLSRDWLEQLTSQADKLKRAAALIEAIPILGDVASAVINLVVDNAQTIENGYNAYSTQQVLNDLACELYCACKADCVPPSIEMIADIYAQAGILEPDWQDVLGLSIEAGLDYLFGTGNLANRTIFCATNLWSFGVLSIGSMIMGWTGLNTIKLWVSLGLNNPNDDWKYHCTECETTLNCSGSTQYIQFAFNPIDDVRVHNLNDARTYTYVIGATTYTLVVQGASIEFFDNYSEPRCWQSVTINTARNSGSVDLPLKVYVDDELVGTFNSNSITTTPTANTFTLPAIARGKKVRLDWSIGLGNSNYESWYVVWVRTNYIE